MNIILYIEFYLDGDSQVESKSILHHSAVSSVLFRVQFLLRMRSEAGSITGSSTQALWFLPKKDGMFSTPRMQVSNTHSRFKQIGVFP